MSVFGDYSRYYDLLYRDKNYAEEAAFVSDIFTRHGCRKPGQLLDLGCGTGRHALHMSQAGFTVTGVDLSPTMLEMGRKEQQTLPPDAPRPNLLHGDARDFRIAQKFDAMCSLFHVMSYQNRECDALAVFATAKAHLLPGGLFFFDFWYGPGVLTVPPTERRKRMEDDCTEIERFARPEVFPNENLVAVHYSVDMRDKQSDEKTSIEETHAMRYWFMPELRHLAACSGLTPVAEGAWMRKAPPTMDTWNAWMMVRA